MSHDTSCKRAFPPGLSSDRYYSPHACQTDPAWALSATKDVHCSSVNSHRLVITLLPHLLERRLTDSPSKLASFRHLTLPRIYNRNTMSDLERKITVVTGKLKHPSSRPKLRRPGASGLLGRAVVERLVSKQVHGALPLHTVTR